MQTLESNVNSISPKSVLHISFLQPFSYEHGKTLFCKGSGRSYSQLKATNPEHPRPSLTFKGSGGTIECAGGAPAEELCCVCSFSIDQHLTCSQTSNIYTWVTNKRQYYTQIATEIDQRTNSWRFSPLYLINYDHLDFYEATCKGRFSVCSVHYFHVES